MAGTFVFDASLMDVKLHVWRERQYGCLRNVVVELRAAMSVSQYGRLQSVTRKDSTGAQIGATTYSYDMHGRQYAVTDARNGSTLFTFNHADQVVMT